MGVGKIILVARRSGSKGVNTGARE